MYNFNMFHAALYRIADKDKPKRGYSNCTGSNDSAAYTLLQMTKRCTPTGMSALS
jgi:hypothetical protein